MVQKQKKITPPKPSQIKKARVSSTGFSTEEEGSKLTQISQDYYNRSIRDVRALSKRDAIRALVKVNGLLSAAVSSFVNTSMSGYTVYGYDSLTHKFSGSGTLVAKSILASLDTLQDYSQGYSDKQSVDSLLQTLVKEVVLTGGCAGELVLDKYRLPDRIVPVNVDKLEWVVKKDKRKYPEQVSSGGSNVPLDIPTFWVESLHLDASEFQPHSMLESALPDVYRFLDFIEDMGVVLKRTGHSRVTASIDLEKAIAAAPAGTQADTEKLATYLTQLQADTSKVLEDATPEEAFVAFDNVTFNMLSAKGESASYTDLLETLSGVVASALKSMPSVLGLRIGKGSQSLSNTESMLYLKSVETIRQPVEALMSRALTLGARLQGEDIYIKFRFDPIDLRPTNELEAHKSVKQSRILNQLSLGFITDDEAAMLLGTSFRDSSLPPLSGTMFLHMEDEAVSSDQISNKQGGQEAALAPDSPDKTPGNQEKE